MLIWLLFAVGFLPKPQWSDASFCTQLPYSALIQYDVYMLLLLSVAEGQWRWQQSQSTRISHDLNDKMSIGTRTDFSLNV
jgi:hypothetical protein